MIVDEASGTVTQRAVDLVPLNLTLLNEDELLAMFPTPVECAARCSWRGRRSRRHPRCSPSARKL